MRWVLVAILCAACGSEPHEPLMMNVVVTSNALAFHAHELGGTDPCSNPFPEIGTRDSETDAYDCEGAEPAAWLAGFRVDEGDACAWNPPQECGLDLGDLGALDDHELVVAADSGDEIRVAFPATPRPIPTITEVTDDGTTTTVSWTSDPPAASVIGVLAHGFGGERVHVAATEPITFESLPPEVSIAAVILTALAAPTSVETDFGTVRFWIGGAASYDLRAD